MRHSDVERRQAFAPAFFDTHCDTVMKVLDDGEEFLEPSRTKHVSFAGMVEANVRAQVFACYVLRSEHPGCEAERAHAMIDVIEEMAHSTEGDLRIARTRGELQEAFSGGPRAALVSLEGADPLGTDADGIAEFFHRGVRSLIFAWQDNAFSGTAFGSNHPLTLQGQRLLGLCEELGIVVDVSHLSDLAFNDVVHLANRPFVASHSNCRALCSNPRNLTDGMIRTLADWGGVMGINLCPTFLDPGFAEAMRPLQQAARNDRRPEGQRDRRRMVLELPRPSLDWVIRHILHAINVGGEDCVGFGGDLDGIGQTPEGIDSVSDYSKLVPLLREAGLSQQQIEKICYRNFLRVFSELLPAD